MNNNQPIKFGLIGAGAIAQAYLRAFQQCEEARIVGVADVREEHAETLAASLGCESFRCYRQLAERSGCEAVVVCTPPSTHPDICIWLLRRGIHVLCEKPLAIDSASARQMLAAADDAKVRLTMASKFRYVDDVMRAKAIVASGVIGEVLLFENSFTTRVQMNLRWNSDPLVSGGGVLIDNGTHSVDIMRYFLGPLTDLQVVEGRRHQNLEVEDTVRMFVRTTTGVMGSIDLSWSMNKEQPFYISIFGSDGTMLIGWNESKYRLRTGQWVQFGNGYDKIGAFHSQILNFTRAIRNEEPLRITSEDALASVEVIEAGYAALRRSQWQQVQYRVASSTVKMDPEQAAIHA